MARSALKAIIPLFPTEAEIAELVLGPGRLEEWKGIATVLQRHGLPAIDPVTGRRYWPGVRAFFDRRAGLMSGSTGGAPHEHEHWGPPIRKPKRRVG